MVRTNRFKPRRISHAFKLFDVAGYLEKANNLPGFQRLLHNVTKQDLAKGIDAYQTVKIDPYEDVTQITPRNYGILCYQFQATALKPIKASISTSTLLKW